MPITRQPWRFAPTDFLDSKRLGLDVIDREENTGSRASGKCGFAPLRHWANLRLRQCTDAGLRHRGVAPLRR
jgi:hypothetical protein